MVGTASPTADPECNPRTPSAVPLASRRGRNRAAAANWREGMTIEQALAGHSAGAVTHGPARPARAVRPNLVVASGILVSLITAIDATVLNVAIPTIRADLGADFAEVEWISSSYSVAFAALLVLFGTLGDVYGQRPFMIGGLLVFLAGSVMAALAASAEMLIVARVIAGIGAAAQAPTHVAAIAAVFPPERRAKPIGITIAGASVGLALGPLVGGLLVEELGWRSIFWVNLPIGAVTLLLTARYVPDTARRKVASLDVLGVVLLAFGLGGIVYGLVESTVRGWTSPDVVVALIAGVVLSLAFVARELRARSPIVDLAVFRRRHFSDPIAISAAVSVGLTSVFLFISIYYQSIRGLSPLSAGLLYLPTTVPIIALSPIASRVADRFGPARVVPGAVLVGAAGLVLLGGITPNTSVAVLALAQLLIGVGVGLSLPVLSTRALNAVASDQGGMAASILKTSRSIAGSFGVAAVGTLVVAFARAAYRSDVNESNLPEAVKRIAAEGDPITEHGGPADTVGPALEIAERAAATGIGRALLVAAALVVVAAVASWLTLRTEHQPQLQASAT
jgi:EmrB/QacA subfamily drug resistance transporter